MKVHPQIYQHCERLYRHYELAFQRLIAEKLIRNDDKITILYYSSYFVLTKSNYFCLALHSAFHSIINFGGWISGLLSRVLLSGDVCLAPVSLVNIHKLCLSVYVRTSEILYI